MNLTGILIAMQNYTVGIDWVKLVISIVIWPIYLYKLIKGAFKS